MKRNADIARVRFFIQHIFSNEHIVTLSRLPILHRSMPSQYRTFRRNMFPLLKGTDRFSDFVVTKYILEIIHVDTFHNIYLVKSKLKSDPPHF